jgi:restriction endonuclease S subunit
MRNFLFYLLLTPQFTEYAIQGSGRVGMPKVNREHLFEFTFGLPTIETQNTLVEQIEKERAAVDACKTLVALFEAKIKTKIAEVWGESQTRGFNS